MDRVDIDKLCYTMQHNGIELSEDQTNALHDVIDDIADTRVKDTLVSMAIKEYMKQEGIE